MKRISVEERPALAEAAARHEFEFQEGIGIPFWDETNYYQFTEKQIDEDLVKPAEEIESLCFEVVTRAMEDETVLQRLGVARQFWDLIADSWQNQERNLYGRMDFSYDGKGPAKLLEYNADTPTTLYESSVFQWEWLEEAEKNGLLPAGCDQFNDIHEKIVEALSNIGIQEILHLGANRDIEDDMGTLEYVSDCAKEAGMMTQVLAMEDIGIDDDGRFTDLEENLITTLFKLYPWEWIFAEEFGTKIASSGTRFIEPAWRSILSNKGLLPILWEMFEGHPNLLPTFFEDDPAADSLGEDYVRKPLLGRQGSNVEIYRDGDLLSSKGGPYGQEGYILQAFHPLPNFSERYPLVGCWLIASKAVGMGIREDGGLITGAEANFVPHLILD